MLLSTTNDIPGRKFEVLGIATGATVRSKNMFKELGASFKSIVGGELGSFQKLLSEAREIAIERMEEHAMQMGADAVIGVRIATAEIMEGAAEIQAYGTAIRFV